MVHDSTHLTAMALRFRPAGHPGDRTRHPSFQKATGLHPEGNVHLQELPHPHLLARPEEGKLQVRGGHLEAHTHFLSLP